MRPKFKFFVGLTRKAMLLTFLILHTAALNAQDARIVFPESSMTIQQAFDEIEKQTDYLLSVNYTDFDVTRKVKLSRNIITVKVAMERILARTGRKYSMHGNHIVVYAANEPEPANLEEIEKRLKAESLAMSKTGSTKTPVDVDSLEQVLVVRKIQPVSAIPVEPVLNTGDYYGKMAAAGTPEYVASLPKLALRTNLLYGLGTLTPNLGLDIALSPQSTLLVTGSYNGWGLNDSSRDRMLCHWIASIEYRYWFCERFNGHFLGAHGYGGNYHIKGVRIPLVMGKGSEDYRYKGIVYGAGVSYGYQMLLGANWNLELNAGIGFGVSRYDRHECDRCGDALDKGLKKTFVAPTKLGISLVYIIKSKK